MNAKTELRECDCERECRIGFTTTIYDHIFGITHETMGSYFFLCNTVAGACGTQAKQHVWGLHDGVGNAVTTAAGATGAPEPGELSMESVYGMAQCVVCCADAKD